jgi:hypothetical protein
MEKTDKSGLIHEIPPLELDALLCKFIIGVRRKNGGLIFVSYFKLYSEMKSVQKPHSV